MIISEKWAQTTRSLRSLRKGEQADFKRRQLPFVTFSGIFSARHSEHIVRHSGLMCFDFDHVGDEIAVRKLQQLLVADPTLNVQLAFRSPSGDGLKVVVECFSLTDNANKLIRWHNAQYAHIASYIEQRYNMKVDKTNDIARACFLCHDQKAYYNSQFIIHNSQLKKSVEIQRALLTKSNSESLNPNGKKSFKSVKSVGDNHSEGVTSVRSVNSVRDKEISVRDKHPVVHQPLTINQTLESAIQLLETHAIDITTQYHDWYRIGMALASHYGEVGRNYYHRISRFYPRYTIEETNKQYNLCLKYNNYRIKLGTIFYLINHQLHHITHKTPIKV